MQFVSYSQLINDIRAWSGRIPNEVSSVTGIPRSGLLAAQVLALHRNVACQGCKARRRAGGGWQGLAGDASLLLDDSICSGATLRHYLKAEQPNGLTGAVYATKEGAKHVDIYYKIVELPRVFEWNLFHCGHMRSACIDLDGVLCVDPTPAENDDGARYARFLQNAAPLFLPSFPVHSVVTNRLEKYRELTERWLGRHHVVYGRLVMSKHASMRERRRAADYAEMKAKYYRASSAYLFVESDLSLARRIREISGKNVLCTNPMALL